MGYEAGVGKATVERAFVGMLDASDGGTRQRCLVMGVLNVTPDSFSDGGRHLDLDSAVAHGHTMAQAGADIIDIGGELTRPGAERVSPAEDVHPGAAGSPALPPPGTTRCTPPTPARLSPSPLAPPL